MTTIAVRHIDSGLFISDKEYLEIDENGTLYLKMRCTHRNIEVTPPCCTATGSSGNIECGCGGMYTVYCPDCNNADLTDQEIEVFIEHR